MRPSSESKPDEDAITECHQEMELRSVSYRVLDSSGWAIRRLAALVAKTLAVATLLALAVWFLVELSFFLFE